MSPANGRVGPVAKIVVKLALGKERSTRFLILC